MTAVISFTAQSQTAPREADPTRRARICAAPRACSAGAAGPILAAALQFIVVHQQIQRALADVDAYPITVLDESDRPAVDRLRRNVPDAQSGGPPENRPSVISMTSCPSPAPLIAPVIMSIRASRGRPWALRSE